MNLNSQELQFIIRIISGISALQFKNIAEGFFMDLYAFCKYSRFSMSVNMA